MIPNDVGYAIVRYLAQGRGIFVGLCQMVWGWRCQRQDLEIDLRFIHDLDTQQRIDQRLRSTPGVRELMVYTPRRELSSVYRGDDVGESVDAHVVPSGAPDQTFESRLLVNGSVAKHELSHQLQRGLVDVGSKDRHHHVVCE